MPVSTPDRPQPPSIEDPEEGNADLWTPGSEGEDGESADSDTDVNWLKRAKDAYKSSTTYVDSNYRKKWDDSIRAFNSQHPGDSKYNSELFRKRSTIFRPKTRAVIRKNEAAAAAAFFSNMDRTSVTAQNQADPSERMSADVMKELLQYRLTKSIPWFQIVCGGLQDAQVQGAAIAHVHWEYIVQHTKTEAKVIKDTPVVDLIPIENFKFDPAASWHDPVNTSPYNIHEIPMYICDVKDRMERPDPKGRTWKHYDDSVLTSTKNDSDSTRAARLQGEQDPTKERRYVSDYDIVWVHRHIHRVNNRDYEFYTLESRYMLTDPEPLKQTVFHGKRPYVFGTCILETHRPIPTSLPGLVKGLQDETNEIGNQRLDNVKLVMNKRYIVKRGKNVDLASLVRNVPAGITLADDPEGDVKTIDFEDVTGSSYQEQDRINADFDDLAGNFSASAAQTQQVGRQSATGMTLLQAPTTILTEYMLKTYSETFVSGVLRHLVLLEQHYETDTTVLALVGNKAQVFQKYGKSEVTDDVLNRELNVSVNVGMGATDPVARLQRFIYAVTSMSGIAKLPPPGMNLQEVFNEIFALSGYQEGDRFFIGNDPQKMKQQQIIQQLMQMLKMAQMEKKNKDGANQAKMHATDANNLTNLLIAQMEHDQGSKEILAKHIMDLDKMTTQAELKPPEKDNGSAQ